MASRARALRFLVFATVIAFVGPVGAGDVYVNPKFPIGGGNTGGRSTLSPPVIAAVDECATHVYVVSFMPKATVRVILNGIKVIGTATPRFAFDAVPLPGHTPEEMRKAIHAEIEKLKTTDVTDEELKMVKTRAKANLIRGLADNAGMAFQLGLYQLRYGDWRELFRSVDRIDKVSKEDIRRVANKTFSPTNRTVGIIETIPGANPQGEKEQ